MGYYLLPFLFPLIVIPSLHYGVVCPGVPLSRVNPTNHAALSRPGPLFGREGLPSLPFR